MVPSSPCKARGRAWEALSRDHALGGDRAGSLKARNSKGTGRSATATACSCIQWRTRAKRATGDEQKFLSSSLLIGLGALRLELPSPSLKAEHNWVACKRWVTRILVSQTDVFSQNHHDSSSSRPQGSEGSRPWGKWRGMQVLDSLPTTVVSALGVCLPHQDCSRIFRLSSSSWFRWSPPSLVARYPHGLD
ncbi:hypothetical protein IWZ03DRAFT_152327 [Phyllosticta citriasiana]|uniref:Uncharacterized protein n=1 Tax=Phyllosticta citriasiana TaxID=595635 RepID=A0ABR1KTR8_9PEZI